MRIVGQDVPSELFLDYCKSLRPSFEKWKNKFKTFKFKRRRFGTGPNIFYARKRSPWRLPHMQNDAPFCPSLAQLYVRMAFMKSLEGFANTPRYHDDVDEYDNGPVSRAWWYQHSAPGWLWYYNVYIQYTWQYMFNDTPPNWTKFRDFNIGMVWWQRGLPEKSDTVYYNPSDIFCGRTWNEDGSLGLEQHLFLQTDADSTFQRLHTFLLWCYNTNVKIDIFTCANDNVNLPSLTWNNAPMLVAKLGTITVGTPNKLYSFHKYTLNNIKSYFGLKRRTIVLIPTVPATSAPHEEWFGFYSFGGTAATPNRAYLAP